MYPLLSFGNMYAKGPIFIQYLYKSALLKKEQRQGKLSFLSKTVSGQDQTAIPGITTIPPLLAKSSIPEGYNHNNGERHGQNIEEIENRRKN